MAYSRHHLVSIVAVAVALALGVATGAYAVNGHLLRNKRHQVTSLNSENAGLRGRLLSLERQQNQAGLFVDGIRPILLADRLSRQRVVLVVAPGGSTAIADAVKTTVTEAGATVSATVRLGKGWLSPEQTSIVADLAKRLAEPGLTLPDGTAYERAGRVLATALLRPPPLTDNERSLAAPATSALAGFKTAGLLTVSPAHPAPGTLAVLVVGNAPNEVTSVTSAANETVTALARELDLAGGGAVIIGTPSSARAGGILAAARADASTSKSVSTVDDADTRAGRIRIVLALAAELHNSSGQYGVGPGVTAPLPAPAPSP